MNRLLKWFCMLTKRLYKKPSFLILALLIPLCVFLFGTMAGESSGFLHVTLAAEDESDPVANKVIQSLLDQDSMIRFSRAESVEAARSAVKNGKADEAWIFPEDTAHRIDQFLEDPENYVVSVVTREQSVTLRLSREKLSAELYEYCAKASFVNYVRENLPLLDAVSDEKLIEYFQITEVEEDLFAFENASDRESGEGENYLTSPIRGLLGIFTVLGGMAATMFHIQDEESGTFSHVRENRRPAVAFGCVATATLQISAVATLSLLLASLGGPLLKELAVTLLYVLLCTAFCLLLRQLFPSLRSYSALIPLLAVLMIGICPVVFDFKTMRALQLLFPPTYYVNALYFDAYLLYMPLYTAACLGLTALFSALKKALRKARG